MGGRDKLQNVSAGLGAGDSDIKLAGYHRVRVEMDLERTFESYRNNVAMLKGKRALIDRQSHAVAAARTHLDAVRSEKARLQDMIAALKTQKRQLDALAASSTHISLDDTALGQAREVLNEVKNRLDIAQKMLEDDIFFEGPVAAYKSNRDIVGEIAKYFADTGETEGVTVEVVEALTEVR